MAASRNRPPMCAGTIHRRRCRHCIIWLGGHHDPHSAFNITAATDPIYAMPTATAKNCARSRDTSAPPGSKHPSSDRCHHRALPAVGALAAWNFQGDEGMDCFPVPIVAFPREESTRAQKPTGPLSGDIRTSTTISNLHHYTHPSPKAKYNGDANTLQTLP
jgi:hypothetical protein